MRKGKAKSAFRQSGTQIGSGRFFRCEGLRMDPPRVLFAVENRNDELCGLGLYAVNLRHVPRSRRGVGRAKRWAAQRLLAALEVA